MRNRKESKASHPQMCQKHHIYFRTLLSIALEKSDTLENLILKSETFHTPEGDLTVNREFLPERSYYAMKRNKQERPLLHLGCYVIGVCSIFYYLFTSFWLVFFFKYIQANNI